MPTQLPFFVPLPLLIRPRHLPVVALALLALSPHARRRRLPQKMQRDPDVRRLTQVCNVGNVTIAHLINRRNAHSASFKDYEFSRATMLELWASGRDDVRQTIAHPEMLKATEVERGVRIYDLAR